jgi:predicted lipoprotein with Yx(FWY)xxD motif
MKTSIIIGIILVVLVVIGGFVWFMQSAGSTATSVPTGSSGTATVPATSGTPTLSSGTSPTLGNYLEAANGMTLYTYQNDTPGTSTCTDTCATTWPPYTVASAANVTADPSVTGTLGTITRSDGTIQVTYNDMPLYFYSQDVNSGDTTGDGVGGVWSVGRP